MSTAAPAASVPPTSSASLSPLASAASPSSPKVGSQSPSSSPSPLAGSGSPADGTTGVSSGADRVDIQGLDTTRAARILIAEVQAALGLSLDAPDALGAPDAQGARDRPDARESLFDQLGSAPLPDTAAASRAIVTLFLQAVPQSRTDAPGIWLAEANRVESNLRSGLDFGLQTISAWRDVPAFVVGSVASTCAIVTNALDDPSSLLGTSAATQLPGATDISPRWTALQKRLQRYRRRRRYAAAGLIDPDLQTRDSAFDRDVDRESLD